MFKRADLLKRDKNALEQHRLRRKEISGKENQIHNLKEEISELRKMVEELKVRIK